MVYPLIGTEVITISQYDDGDHYYLTSSIGRVFKEIKVNSLTEAYEICDKIIPKVETKYKKHPSYRTLDGD